MPENIQTINEKLDTLLERTAALQVQVSTLVGNGQKGRMKEAEEDIEALQSAADRFRGALWVLGIVAPFLGAFISWIVRKLGY
jgi:hypothetical protein